MRTLAFLAMIALTGTAQAGDVTKGKSLYTAKCLACHGGTGKGDGAAARALPTAPPDMSTATFWADRTDEDLKTVLANGTPGGVMRAFPMSDEQMADLIAYLRSLSTPAK